MRHTTRVRTIGILALPGFQLLDVAGPVDVFAEANVQSGRTAYATRLFAVEPGPVVSSSGLALLPDDDLSTARPPVSDTFLVAGAPHVSYGIPDNALLAWVANYAPHARRYGSVCSGALVLAAAGLLDGRRATTHWAVAEQLASDFPTVRVEADALHVRDGPVRTSAGVTAGLDLAVALVEEDLGSEIARKVASQLVMFFKRPGGQMQFSRQEEMTPGGRSALQEVQRWIIAHPAEDASLSALAARAGLSNRHFARLFQQEIGQTTAEWVEAVRVQAARKHLEAGERPKQVAIACGFGNIDTFRRVFQKQTGVSPSEYRRRFESHLPAD